jgi:Na+/melibiose symporter-like transporter
MSPRYPQVGESKFTSFLGKIGLGLAFSFIPAFMFALLNRENLFYSWGITLLMVSGIFFVIAAWKDLSRTSVRKSYKKYRERLELTQKHEDKFQFSLGFLQFGQTIEDIGAAICLLSIGAMMLTMA